MARHRPPSVHDRVDQSGHRADQRPARGPRAGDDLILGLHSPTIAGPAPVGLPPARQQDHLAG
jgi:hypothetical protein